jgi:hypothetical protein
LLATVRLDLLKLKERLAGLLPGQPVGGKLGREIDPLDS